MNELAKFEHESIDSNIKYVNSSVEDGFAVITMMYDSLVIIIDKEKVMQVVSDLKSDAVIYCVA